MNNGTFYIELLGSLHLPLLFLKWISIIPGLLLCKKVKEDFLFETNRGLVPSLFLLWRNTHILRPAGTLELCYLWPQRHPSLCSWALGVSALPL